MSDEPKEIINRMTERKGKMKPFDKKKVKMPVIASAIKRAFVLLFSP